MRSFRRQVSIGDLDDDCLLRIFSFLNPLPDLFNVARTSRRPELMRKEQGGGPGDVYIPRYRKPLQPAEQEEAARQDVDKPVCGGGRRCRPGDTIVMEQGEEHAVSDCIVPWPLHLKGRGRRPEDTVLVACRGSSALLFMASAKMANLTVKARRAACVVHQRGRLLVDACLLHCNAEGLDHLFAPLVTLAHSRSGLPSGALPPPSCLEPASPPLAAFSPPAHAAQPLPGEALWGMPHDDAQAGALIVLGSKIKGGRGSVAVHTLGSGSLQNVRIINMSQECLFWFEVDSAAQRTAAASPRTDLSPGDASLSGTSGDGPAAVAGPSTMTTADRWAPLGPAGGAPDAPPSAHLKGQALRTPPQCPGHEVAGSGLSCSGAGTGSGSAQVSVVPWEAPVSGEACPSNVLLRSKLWRSGASASPGLPATPPASEPGAPAARLLKRPKPTPRLGIH